MQLWTKFVSFMIQVQRVLLVTRKPTAVEFKMVAKITGLGIAVIGAIGFLLQIGKQILFPA
ncbi:protein translocase SEC61 complex subunit gamma [Candidatus Woesearchaeota archaeon]|nr:MAG: protein translocase SEC61 complex subunit gamma [Candidatus Woesearchaeota archaeon]